VSDPSGEAQPEQQDQQPANQNQSAPKEDVEQTYAGGLPGF
jgi:hypothetical protein